MGKLTARGMHHRRAGVRERASINQTLNRKKTGNEPMMNCFCGGGIMCRVGNTVKQSEDKSKSRKSGEARYLEKSLSSTFPDFPRFTICFSLSFWELI